MNTQAVLKHHHHGKGRVRVVKVKRTPEAHYIWQYTLEILVESPDAELSYYTGDNSSVLPTDSIKNTVFALAKKHEFHCMEDFGILVAKHFIQRHGQMFTKSTVNISETQWKRIENQNSKGVIQPHHHAFVDGGSDTRSATIVAKNTRHGIELDLCSSISDLKVIKTTQSSFVKFFKDEYTSLPEVSDRLVGTIVTACWKYKKNPSINKYDEYASKIKSILISAFAGPSDVGTPSPAVQYTLYKMGEAVLQQCPEVEEIKIKMPNVHNLPYDQSHFGLHNEHPHGEIFLPVDEPHGIIEAIVTRSQKSRL